MIVYVNVPGSQAGEVNVRKVVGGVNRFGGPREGAGLDLRESKLGGAGAEAAGGGINIKVKNLCRGGWVYWKYGVER